MTDSDIGHYLICYDIADPKRFSKVHRTLKNQGLPVQFLVFTVTMKRPSLLKLLERLEGILKRNEDDMRCYRIPEHLEVKTFGWQTLPTDVPLFTDGTSRI